MCSELTPRARIPDTRIPQFMQPCIYMFNNKYKYRACKCLRPRRKGQLIAPIFLPVFNSSVSNYTQFGLLIQGRNTTTSTIDGKWWYQFSFSYQYTNRKVKIERRGKRLAIAAHSVHRTSFVMHFVWTINNKIHEYESSLCCSEIEPVKSAVKLTSKWDDKEFNSYW